MAHLLKRGSVATNSAVTARPYRPGIISEKKQLQDQLYQELGIDFQKSIELDTAAAIAFVARLKSWHGQSSGLRATDFSVKTELQPQVAISARQLDFNLVADGDKPAAEVTGSAVLQAWRRGESLVSLSDGSFAAVPQGLAATLWQAAARTICCETGRR